MKDSLIHSWRQIDSSIQMQQTQSVNDKNDSWGDDDDDEEHNDLVLAMIIPPTEIFTLDLRKSHQIHSIPILKIQIS